MFWDTDSRTICVDVERVTDSNLKGEYNYEFALSLDEVGTVLRVLSGQALREDPEVVAEKLGPFSRDLLRLLLASGRFPPSNSNKA